MSRPIGWLLNCCYAAVILMASPVISWRMLRQGKYRTGFAAKFVGRVPVRSGEAPCIWLHAVSVGEVNLLATTIAELRRQRPDCDIVVSTTTVTGFELARKKYAAYTVCYCPLDFSWACAAAVNRLRPNLLVLAELELWPNLIAAAKRGGAKVAIVNGRLSDASFRGYRRLRPLVARVLRQLDLVAVQDEETRGRFATLGAKPQSLFVTGSVKFDGAETNRDNPRTVALKSLAGIRNADRVVLAGSTQAPEEQYAIDVLRRRMATGVDGAGEGSLRLILVPRHAERFEDVAQLVAASGLPWTRRSQLGGPVGDSLRESPATLGESRRHSGSPWQILLVDAIGELGAWWGTADVGFVGGSFGSRGGQNMLEPAAYGVPTCFGPNTWNFRDIVRRLLAVDGARVVRNAGELEEFVNHTLDEPHEAAALGARARQLVLSQQGATRRTVELLGPLVAEPIASAVDAREQAA
ncbi:MAG: 3-deoxy-D-manno-octulosonic acid transferase [Pirellulales bacterium]|nr:3-deoxy-D-manno-octulosonic acid transferase [Pirellulales bacterium]